MTERKLASVRKIKAIEPIEGADKIVKAVVDGWELVTQKSNNFKPGDLVVFFEVDSLLPICDQFSFLEPHKVTTKNSVNGEGYRLKTIKLRGTLSQGLILPIESLFETVTVDGKNYITIPEQAISDEMLLEVIEGLDLTNILNIKKYDKPIPANLAGKIRGNFPVFIPKTDQERIQNCFDDWFNGPYHNDTFEVSLKLDGSSTTMYLNENRFGVCSRNLDLLETEDNAFWTVARKFKVEERMRSLSRNIAIQGELMGPGVQGNRERLESLTIFIFDIYDIDQRRYLPANQRYELLDIMGLLDNHIWVLDTTKLTGFMDVKSFLSYAEQPSLFNDVAEGLVFKSIEHPDFSFKAISNKFLIKEE